MFCIFRNSLSRNFIKFPFFQKSLDFIIPFWYNKIYPVLVYIERRIFNMKYCSKCGKELVDEAVICTNCGCAVVAPPSHPFSNSNDQINFGLCVLAFFIPLFGIIYWPVKHKECPKNAKTVGIVGIASWALYLLIISFTYILSFIF